MEPNHLSKYAKMFEKEMSEIDPLQQVILKGHLIIEAALDNIISIIFFHPEHVLKGRFTFSQKIQLARAYGLRKDTNSIWNLILSVNEVRNEVAHNLAGEKRDRKLKQLHRLFIAEATAEMREALEKHGAKLEEMSEEVIVAHSCFLCTGFLGTYEEDISVLRGIIDTIDHGMNPDLQRVPRKSPEDARKK